MKRFAKLIVPIVILAIGVLGAVILQKTRPRVEPKAPEIVAPIVQTLAVTPGPVQLVVRAQGE